MPNKIGLYVTDNREIMLFSDNLKSAAILLFSRFSFPQCIFHLLAVFWHGPRFHLLAPLLLPRLPPVFHPDPDESVLHTGKQQIFDLI